MPFEVEPADFETNSLICYGPAGPLTKLLQAQMQKASA